VQSTIMGISPNARVCTKHKDRTAGTTCRSSASSSPSPDFRDSSGDSSARVERRAPHAKTAKGKFAESSLFIVREPALHSVRVNRNQKSPYLDSMVFVNEP
jgi:hypothetical protein